MLPKLRSVVHFKLLSHWGLFTISIFPLLGSHYVIPKVQDTRSCSLVRMESEHWLWVWKGVPGAMTPGPHDPRAPGAMTQSLSSGVAATTGSFQAGPPPMENQKGPLQQIRRPCHKHRSLPHPVLSFLNRTTGSWTRPLSCS